MDTCPNCKKSFYDPKIPYKYSDGSRCRSDLSTGLPVSSPNKEGPFAPKQCLKCMEVLSQEHFHTKPLHTDKGTTYRLRYLCKECERENHRARSHAWLKRKHEEFQVMWYTWNKALAHMPNKPVTDEAWIKTCRYFNGCCMCNERHVESREFFQKAVHSGTYSALNILPMCGKCSSKFRRIDNPFEYFTPFKAFGVNLSTARLKILMEFIAMKLQEVLDE